MTQATPLPTVIVGNAFKRPTINTTDIILVAIYLRVSTDEQAEDGFGIPAQRDKCQAYCLRFPNFRVFDVYIDDGVSGTRTDRDAMNRLLKDAETNPIKFVIVARLDRHDREEYAGYFLEHELAERGVALVSARDDSNPFEIKPLQRGVVRLLGAEDRRKILDNTNDGRQKAAENGYWVGGRLPYGYTSTGGKKSIIIIDKDEAAVLRRAVDLMVDDGLNLRETCDALNAAGLRTRSKTVWQPSNLYSKLASDGLAGKTTFRNTKHGLTKTGPDGSPLLGSSIIYQLPRIITEERHLQLRAALEANSHADSSRYLLTRHLLGSCGGRMRGAIVKGVRRYICVPGCSDRGYNAEPIENAVWEALAEFLKDREKLSELAEEWVRELPGDRERHERNRAALELDVEKHRKMLENLSLQLLDPDTDADEREILQHSKISLMLTYKERKGALEQVTKLLHDLAEAQAEVTRMASLLQKATVRLDKMGFVEQRALLRLLKVKITVAPGAANRGDSGPESPLDTWHRENDVLVPADPDDEAWERVVGLLRERGVQLLRFRVGREGLRDAICGMLHRLRTGCKWAEVPAEFSRAYGGYESVRALQSRLWHKGLWPEIVTVLGPGLTPIRTPSPYPELLVEGRFNPALVQGEEFVVDPAARFSSVSSEKDKILYFELHVV